MFTQMFTIEAYKLRRRTLVWVETAVLILSVVAVLGVMLMIRQMTAAGITESGSLRIEGIDHAQAQAFVTWPGSFPFMLSIVPSVGVLLVIILSGAVTAQEYTWRSFQLWLSRGVSRPVVLLAKFTAVAAAGLLLVAAATLAGGLVSSLTSWQILGSVPFAAVNWGSLLLAILTVTLSLLPYAALALLLAVLSRSTVVAIGGGLAFSSLIEPLTLQLLPLLGDRWAEITAYFPASLAQMLNSFATARIADGAAAISGSLSAPAAAGLLALYTLLPLGAALLLFQRQDLGG